MSNGESVSGNIQKEEPPRNLFISIFYCKHWDIWEALREILQNQMDGMIIKAKDRQNIKINRIDINNFIFTDETNERLLGEIHYDPENKELIVWNLGHLETADLLLGGNKIEEQLIGRFGEGMKLSALALLRKDRTFTICNGDEQWSFSLNLDEYFTKNGEIQECLFWSKKIHNEKGIIKVIIKNIEPKKWEDTTDKILWLADKNEFHCIEAIDGRILFGEKFKNKLYVKGIFIEDTLKNRNEKNDLVSVYGFNADFDLDRDRNTVVQIENRNALTSKIIAYVLNNLDKLRGENSSDEYLIECLNKFTKEVVSHLGINRKNVCGIWNHLSVTAKDLIWDEWSSLNGNKGKQPVYNSGYYFNEVDKFLVRRGFRMRKTDVSSIISGAYRIREKSE